MNKITQDVLKEFEKDIKSRLGKGYTLGYSEIIERFTHALTTYREAIIKEVEGKKVDTDTLPSSTEIDFETMQLMRRDMKKFGEGFNSGIDTIIQMLKSMK